MLSLGKLTHMAQVYDKGLSPDEQILGRECPVCFFSILEERLNKNVRIS